MNNQRAGGRAALDAENFLHRFRIQRIRAQAINSFGRKSYQLPFANACRGVLDLLSLLGEIIFRVARGLARSCGRRGRRV